MKRVAITGANGFIGSHLAKVFSLSGYEILSLTRKVGYDLRVDVDAKKLKDVDVLIHCAFIQFSKDNSNASEINKSGTKKLLDAARAAGVKKIVYLSSMSAHEMAESQYGRSKLEIEKLFDLSQDLVLRPGLVIGEGGVFFKLKQFIESHKLIPLLDGGRQPIQTISLIDLGKVIFELIEKDQAGQFVVAEKPGPMLIDLYRELAHRSGKQKIFLPVPLIMAERVARLSNLLGFTLPFESESIKSLKHLMPMSTADIEKMITFSISDYKKSISGI